jgi:hypothetical protein
VKPQLECQPTFCAQRQKVPRKSNLFESVAALKLGQRAIFVSIVNVFSVSQKRNLPHRTYLNSFCQHGVDWPLVLVLILGEDLNESGDPIGINNLDKTNQFLIEIGA